jgi:deazaflavin-dependent oxidoreductase (nitroreductase family)
VGGAGDWWPNGPAVSSSIVCLLSGRGRRTGRWRSTPVVVLDHLGGRYLLAAYGDTDWSRNLRAAGGGRLVTRSRVEEFTAIEVAVEQQPPLIAAYLREFGGLPHVGRTFRALPDPAHHRVFLITTAPTSATS